MNQFDRLFAVSGLSLDRLRSFLEVAEAGNIARAAKADPTRQSQFSRQVKELESFFGVALTRRAGRRIEITPEGHRLAEVIRRHLSALDDFRETMSGRPVSVRLGAAASLLEWTVIPKLNECVRALGGATLELEQSRSADVVRGVTDGRFDFGIVREDAVTKKMKHWKLGTIGYSLFVGKDAVKKGSTALDVIRNHPMAELSPGGQFHEHWLTWLASTGLKPNVTARAGSFTHLARLVRHAGLAAVLPENAKVEFDPRKIVTLPLHWKHARSMIMLRNAKILNRSGIPSNAEPSLAKILSWEDLTK